MQKGFRILLFYKKKVRNQKSPRTEIATRIKGRLKQKTKDKPEKFSESDLKIERALGSRDRMGLGL